MSSFDEAARKIAALAPEVERQLEGQGSGLRVIGEELLTTANASRPGRGVPVDIGTLRSTGRVTGPVSGARGPTVLWSYGGPAAPYAVVQHERLDFAHTVGEARWMVRAIERWNLGGSAARDALKANAEQGIRAASRR